MYESRCFNHLDNLPSWKLRFLDSSFDIKTFVLLIGFMTFVHFISTTVYLLGLAVFLGLFYVKFFTKFEFLNMLLPSEKKEFWILLFYPLFLYISFFYIILSKIPLLQHKLLINNKEHIVKINWLFETKYYHKGRLHREEPLAAVSASRFFVKDGYNGAVYLFGEKICQAQQTIGATELAFNEAFNRLSKMYRTKDQLEHF